MGCIGNPSKKMKDPYCSWKYILDLDSISPVAGDTVQFVWWFLRYLSLSPANHWANKIPVEQNWNEVRGENLDSLRSTVTYWRRATWHGTRVSSPYHVCRSSVFKCVVLSTVFSFPKSLSYEAYKKWASIVVSRRYLEENRDPSTHTISRCITLQHDCCFYCAVIMMLFATKEASVSHLGHLSLTPIGLWDRHKRTASRTFICRWEYCSLDRHGGWAVKLLVDCLKGALDHPLFILAWKLCLWKCTKISEGIILAHR